MPDAQPKPTAVDVIDAEERRIQSFVDFDRHRDECVAEINGMRRALRILDAAGLLVTAKHDAQVRADAHREWFCADPVAALGYWQIPCDDCAGTGSFPMPDGYDGDSSCVRCKATGWLLLSMVDPGAEAVLVEHDAQVLRDAAASAPSALGITSGSRIEVGNRAADWLRARAARIETGAQP